MSERARCRVAFVAAENLSKTATAQFRYVLDFLQRSENGKDFFQIAPSGSREELRAIFNQARTTIFVGETSSALIELACGCGTATLYWAIGLPGSGARPLVPLRAALDAADVIVAATAADAIMFGGITRTSLVVAGIGVPPARSRIRQVGELRTLESEEQRFSSYAEFVRAIGDCDVLIAGRSRLAIAEGMSHGKCVFFPGSHELVDCVLDGVNGFVLRDEANTVATLALLKKDPERLHKIGKAAVQTWKSNFRVEDVASRIRDTAGRAAAGEFPKRAPDRSYAAWIERFDTVRERERIAIRRHLRGLRRHPLISIVLPVYNPQLDLLEAAIKSVREQIYESWELCIADDASTNPEVPAALNEFAASDTRIKITFREHNGHIAACSNSALALATGEWVALLDQDDLLAEHALAVVAATLNQHPEAGLIYSDEDKIDETGARCRPYFKSDWNPELLLGQNCICHLGVYCSALLREVGSFREGFDGAQDYDVVLRCSERLRAEQIRHIPRVLYHWRMVEGSAAQDTEAKPYAREAARRAIADHLERSGIAGHVIPCPENAEWHRVVYDLPDPAPLVSLIIPTRDYVELLEKCVASVRHYTSYFPIEIIVVDNGSVEREARGYLEKLAAEPDTRVVNVGGEFNFSRLINRGATEARGEILVLLNNDTEATEASWLREMVSHAVRKEVGAVGARLWFPDNTLQHGGVITGLGGVASHAFHRFPAQPPPNLNRTFILTQNYSAVTAACMAVRREVFENVHGFDEALAANFNDVDFCLRLRERGWQIVWTPYANLIHRGSASRGVVSFDQKARVQEELEWMNTKWGDQLHYDPFYSPNLSLILPGLDLAFPPRLGKLDTLPTR